MKNVPNKPASSLVRWKWITQQQQCEKTVAKVEVTQVR